MVYMTCFIPSLLFLVFLSHEYLTSRIVPQCGFKSWTWLVRGRPEHDPVQVCSQTIMHISTSPKPSLLVLAYVCGSKLKFPNRSNYNYFSYRWTSLDFLFVEPRPSIHCYKSVSTHTFLSANVHQYLASRIVSFQSTLCLGNDRCRQLIYHSQISHYHLSEPFYGVQQLGKTSLAQLLSYHISHSNLH